MKVKYKCVYILIILVKCFCWPSNEPSECSTFDEGFKQSCDDLMNKFDSNVDKIVGKIDSLSSKLSCASNPLPPSSGEPSTDEVESETPPSQPPGEEGTPSMP